MKLTDLVFPIPSDSDVNTSPLLGTYELIWSEWESVKTVPGLPSNYLTSSKKWKRRCKTCERLISMTRAIRRLIRRRSPRS